jgi:Kelch motif
MPWTNEPPLGLARVGLAAATCDAPVPESGYRIYAIGGYDGVSDVPTVEAYDTVARTWSNVAPMITARGVLAAASGAGRLYAIGGEVEGNPVSTHEIYDPAAGTWEPAPSLLTPRGNHAAVTGRDGLIYAIGGFNNGVIATVEAFDPTTNAWTARASMPTARLGLAAVTGPDGLIYAIGGSNSTGFLTTVEVFNPVTNSWATGPSIPDACRGLAAAVGPDGLIYAMGGRNASGIALNNVYSYDPTTAGPWVVQPSLPTGRSYLAADTGPDGLIYAISGEGETSVLNTVEAFTVATMLTAPDPYIGNGTYQSPDIILLDSSDTPVPIGGAPGGAWDTLLLPNTYYGIQAVIYNDSTVAAANTVVRFWHFSGGVGTAGTQIDMQTVTVPANGLLVVTSANPFQSGGIGQHECVAVSVANSQSLYFNVDPTTATQVIDPTIAQPAASGHFGSAWRNTNSLGVGAGEGLVFPFQANLPGIERPVSVKLAVTATKVAVGFDRAGEAAVLRKALAGAGVHLRLPLFLVPEIRSQLPAADLALKIHIPNVKDEGVRSPGTVEHHVTANPGEATLFTVLGTIPQDARTGDIFLVNVAAHYPPTSRTREAVVEYLEVIYLKR